MHAFVSSLISATLLLHAVLGCCWHHEHVPAVGCQSANNVVGSHRHPADADHGCGCNHQSGGQHESEEPCPGDSHCQGVCTYLPPQKTSFEIPLTVTPLAIVASIDPLADCSSAAVPSWLDALFCTAAPPPVRLHLAQQVLLI
ncbi:MAG: hypothetical protein AB7U73_07855 [Pirellulales bacterium]